MSGPSRLKRNQVSRNDSAGGGDCFSGAFFWLYPLGGALAALPDRDFLLAGAWGLSGWGSRLGCRDPQTPIEKLVPIHNGGFAPMEEALPIGIEVMTAAALKFLEQ